MFQIKKSTSSIIKQKNNQIFYAKILSSQLDVAMSNGGCIEFLFYIPERHVVLTIIVVLYIAYVNRIVLFTPTTTIMVRKKRRFKGMSTNGENCARELFFFLILRSIAKKTKIFYIYFIILLLISFNQLRRNFHLE